MLGVCVAGKTPQTAAEFVIVSGFTLTWLVLVRLHLQQRAQFGFRQLRRTGTWMPAAIAPALPDPRTTPNRQ